MKFLFRLVIFFIIMIAAAIVFKNLFLTSTISKIVKKTTGMEVEIQSLDVGVKNTSLGIRGLKLMNPQGFSEHAMFSAPEIFVDVDPKDLFKKKVHLNELKLDFDQLVIEKNAQGQINVQALQKELEKRQPSGASEKPSSTGGGEKPSGKKDDSIPEIQIDHLIIKLGKVIYRDFSGGGEPVIKEYSINLYEKYENVNGVGGLLMTVVQKALLKSALKQMVNIDFQMSDEMQKEAGKFLQDAAGEFLGNIKLPFGE